MNQQQIIADLDALAGSLSALAGQVNTLKLKLELEKGGRKRGTGHSSARWAPEESEDARRRAIDLKQTPEQIGRELNRTPAAIMAHLRKDLSPAVYNAWLKGCRR